MPRKRKPAAEPTDLTGLSSWTLARIARAVSHDWTQPYFGARTYLQALAELDTCDLSAAYGCEDARGMVRGFLANAQTYRGQVARAVKAELLGRLHASQRGAA
jgi:hypothetical protein